MAESYSETFLLQQIKHSALRVLEEKIEKHLKNEFYNKWLPRTMDQIRKDLMVEIVSDHDFMDLKIKLNNQEEK